MLCLLAGQRKGKYMKKKTWIIHLCILLLIAGVVYLALESPEFALYQMKTDFQAGGFEAVLPHLTHEAYEKILPVLQTTEKIKQFSESDIIKKIGELSITQWIMDQLNIKDTMAAFVHQLNMYTHEIFWDVESIIRNHEKANVTLRFDFNEEFCGSIDLELVRISGNWMINDLYNLNLDNFPY